MTCGVAIFSNRCSAERSIELEARGCEWVKFSWGEVKFRGEGRGGRRRRERRGLEER